MKWNINQMTAIFIDLISCVKNNNNNFGDVFIKFFDRKNVLILKWPIFKNSIFDCSFKAQSINVEVPDWTETLPRTRTWFEDFLLISKKNLRFISMNMWGCLNFSFFRWLSSFFQTFFCWFNFCSSIKKRFNLDPNEI